MFPAPTPGTSSAADATPSLSAADASNPGHNNTSPPVGHPALHTSSLRRRRRHSIPDPSDNVIAGGSSGGEGTGSDTASEEQSTTQQQQTRSQRLSPPPKRRRLANMRPEDGVSSNNQNGLSQVSNGYSRSLFKKALSSHSLNGSSNGDSQLNGSLKSPTPLPSYFGHDREQVTRILIQGLYDLGYTGAASALTRESGYELESPAVAAFRSAVLNGEWSEAENILSQAFHSDGLGKTVSNDDDRSARGEKLLLAENADKNEMLFYLRQQKFLELLEARDLGAALMVLRGELTPLNYDIGRLHALSSLLMCPAEHLHNQTGWDGSISSSRVRLLSELSKSISPSVMIPDHRLAVLLDYIKRTQIKQCLYHNTPSTPSLYSDHVCDRNDFPLRPTIELSQHSNEVWYCGFSHDGTKLVTTSRDRSVIIYDTSTFSVLHRLTEHEEGVAHATWSPDDSKLITCSQDEKARVWSVETGRCLLTINHHRQPVTAAAWAADGESFVTASLDLSSQLCHWSMRGQPVYMWAEGFRVQDCCTTPDGRRLLAADTGGKIHVYNFHTHEEEYCLSLEGTATSVAVSRDSRYMLVNLAEGQIQLIDIETTNVIRRFKGQKQGTFVIRSTFGGAAESFVFSGSEDARVYMWHIESGDLLETLEGHISGCVNAISWNPTNPGMFASAGDDRLVRIWTRDYDVPGDAVGKRRAVSSNAFTRTSAIRSTSNY